MLSQPLNQRKKGSKYLESFGDNRSGEGIRDEQQVLMVGDDPLT